MVNRLVVPLAFLIGLVSLFFVIQTLSDSPSNKPLTSPELIKQYAINPIALIEAVVTDKDDKKIELPKLITGPTLITFWSSGCGECATELPVLDSFASNQTKIKMVIINVKDEPATAQTKLTELKVNLPTYFDRDGSAFQAYEATMPSSYYIDGGLMRFFFPGRLSDDYPQALLTIR